MIQSKETIEKQLREAKEVQKQIRNLERKRLEVQAEDQRLADDIVRLKTCIEYRDVSQMKHLETSLKDIQTLVETLQRSTQ